MEDDSYEKQYEDWKVSFHKLSECELFKPSFKEAQDFCKKYDLLDDLNLIALEESENIDKEVRRMAGFDGRIMYTDYIEAFQHFVRTRLLNRNEGKRKVRKSNYRKLLEERKDKSITDLTLGLIILMNNAWGIPTKRIRTKGTRTVIEIV